ncbi:MAG: hypothetical protein MUO67_22220 [Anaerolineales bacterium]|nr:hypothetical protein [Anaerolineales bacterium]
MVIVNLHEDAQIIPAETKVRMRWDIVAAWTVAVGFSIGVWIILFFILLG